ncbi:MAG: hypothetical protein P1V81_11500 [Planctomycetota bacterium]|nr:hypothetical protein [Planctomycetota bacterium]
MKSSGVRASSTWGQGTGKDAISGPRRFGPGNTAGSIATVKGGVVVLGVSALGLLLALGYGGLLSSSATGETVSQSALTWGAGLEPEAAAPALGLTDEQRPEGAALDSRMEAPEEPADAAPQPYGGERWQPTRDEVLEHAEKEFGLDEREREQMRRQFAPVVHGLGLEHARTIYGEQLTQAGYELLSAAEQPFAQDLEALAELYVTDYDYALRDMWISQVYSFEEAPPGQPNRTQQAGESSIRYPGYAIYFSISEQRYPHLFETLETAEELKTQRKYALFKVARSLD